MLAYSPLLLNRWVETVPIVPLHIYLALEEDGGHSIRRYKRLVVYPVSRPPHLAGSTAAFQYLQVPTYRTSATATT